MIDILKAIPYSLAGHEFAGAVTTFAHQARTETSADGRMGGAWEDTGTLGGILREATDEDRRLFGQDQAALTHVLDVPSALVGYERGDRLIADGVAYYVVGAWRPLPAVEWTQLRLNIRGDI